MALTTLTYDLICSHPFVDDLSSLSLCMLKLRGASLANCRQAVLGGRWTFRNAIYWKTTASADSIGYSNSAYRRTFFKNAKQGWASFRSGRLCVCAPMLYSRATVLSYNLKLYMLSPCKWHWQPWRTTWFVLNHTSPILVYKSQRCLLVVPRCVKCLSITHA